MANTLSKVMVVIDDDGHCTVMPQSQVNMKRCLRHLRDIGGIDFEEGDDEIERLCRVGTYEEIREVLVQSAEGRSGGHRLYLLDMVHNEWNFQYGPWS